MPLAKPATIVPGPGMVSGFLRDQEIYPDAYKDGGSATDEWREPASSDRLPSIGVSLQPAVPRRVAPQQSPLPLHQSPTILAQFQSQRANQNSAAQLHCRDARKLALLGLSPNGGVISTLHAG